MDNVTAFERASEIVDFRSHFRLGEGVYAEVFAINSRAYKLFKSGPEVPPRQTREGRRQVFESQCEAFQIALTDPWLRHHVAAFHGPRMVKDVLDSEGTSVSNSYLLDCCYALELIGPKEIDFKVTAEWVRNGNEHIRQAVEQFDRLGINALDSTVFFYADRDRFKFIDIEMKYYF